MEVIKKASSVLVYCWAFLAMAVCGSAQDSYACCNTQANCKQVSTLNLTIQQYASLSPYHDVLTSSGFNIEASRCSTFFPINNTTFLEFVTTVDKDNSTLVKVFIITDLPGCRGVYRVQGKFGDLGNETSVHNRYLVDVACPTCQPIYLSYRCFLYDSCEYVNAENDFVVGVTVSVNNSQSCLNRFESLVRRYGFDVPEFVRLDGPRRCVTRFNNASCVNADRVDPRHAISYPEQSSAPSC